MMKVDSKQRNPFAFRSKINEVMLGLCGLFTNRRLGKVSRKSRAIEEKFLASALTEGYLFTSY